MSEIDLQAQLDIEKVKRAEAEAATHLARQEMNTAILRTNSIEGVIGDLLERVKVPEHIAEHMREMDARDRLDFLLKCSGKAWTINTYKRLEKSNSEKAKLAANPRHY